MALDPQYILMQDIEELFVDKDTGLLLANGTVEFWIDDQRNTPKSVYQLTGAPPNYTYTPIVNPMPLNIISTPSSNGVDNVAIYYRPYDDFGDIQLYYIVVKNQAGTIQCTREAWPNTIAANNPAGAGEAARTNLLSNPQFVDVNFDPTQTLSLTVAGAGNYTFNIAPSWDLLLSTSGASTIQVTRTSIAGSSKLATNPAYTLTITPGANTTGVNLIQRLYHNPGIWTANILNQLGWVATSASWGPQASQLTISYVPSTGTPTILLQQTNNTGIFSTFNNTVQIDPSDNTETSTAGYADIFITLPASNPTTLSSIQVISLGEQVLDLPYDQQPVNRQQDFLSHYYKPLLAYKPIPSFLVGWDFPLNPSQFYANGARGTQAIGADKSEYKWDQTIVFQSTDSGVAVSRGTNGGFVMTANGAGQVAVIQYLDQVEARKILSDRASVHISGSTTAAAGSLAGKVTLYATTAVTLPDVDAGTNNSIVATLDATGKPATLNGTNWTEVPRGLGDAYFSLSAASATNSESADINLNGWDMQGAIPTNTATFFAIVVGFAAWADTDTITLNSIGLCAGDIATRPAPKTITETTLDSQRFFWKTFLPNTTPVDNAGVNSGEYIYTTTNTTAGTQPQSSPTIFFPEVMRVTPNIAFFNPSNTGAGQAYNETRNTVCTSTAIVNSSVNGLSMVATPTAGYGIGDLMAAHITADARLGIV